MAAPSRARRWTREGVLSLMAVVPYVGGAITRLVDNAAAEKKLDAVEGRLRDVEAAVAINPTAVRSALEELIELARPTGSDSPPALRHAQSCLAIARWLSENSSEGQAQDPQLSVDDGLTLLDSLPGVENPLEELQLVAYELERSGLVYKNMNGNGPAGLGSLGPRAEFFWRTDALFQPWDPAEDALVLCRMGREKEPFQIPQADQELGWGVRRMNAGLGYLWFNGLVRRFGDFGGFDYALRGVHFSEEARFFLDANEPSAS